MRCGSADVDQAHIKSLRLPGTALVEGQDEAPEIVVTGPSGIR